MTSIPGLSIRVGTLPAPIGPGAKPPTDQGPAAAASSAGEIDFESFARMTPAAQIRAGLLQKLGVTDDQLKTMGSEQRKAVDDKLQDLVKQQLASDPGTMTRPGLIADIKA